MEHPSAAPPPSPDVGGPHQDPLPRALVGALPRLRAHLARSGGDVDDLAQEAATRALGARASFDPGRGLWPWLRRIADRVRFDHYARRAATPEARHDLDPPAPGTQEAGLAEEREAAHALVRGLPPREREALLRFHVHGATVDEIAATLGVPAGTVKSDLSRARRRLAAWHDGPGDDPR